MLVARYRVSLYMCMFSLLVHLMIAARRYNLVAVAIAVVVCELCRLLADVWPHVNVYMLACMRCISFVSICVSFTSHYLKFHTCTHHTYAVSYLPCVILFTTNCTAKLFENFDVRVVTSSSSSKNIHVHVQDYIV